MPGVTLTDYRMAIQAVGAALIAAVSVVMCRIILGGHLGELTLLGAAVPAAIAFVLVAACAYVGRRYGFLLLWALLLVGWVRILATTLPDAPFTVMVLLPDSVLAWSMMAVPLALATAFWTRHSGASTHRILVVAAVWLALLMANASLARFAPDVGSTPRQEPLLVWLVGLPSVVAPFLIPITFIRRLYTPQRR